MNKAKLVANEESALREVEQELAEQRQQEMISKYAPLLIGGAAAILIGVGGWQFYTSQKTRKAEAAAIGYQNALFAKADNPLENASSFDAIIQGSSDGYAALAAMQQAASYVEEGDTVRAHAAYRAIIAREGVTDSMKKLARLRAAFLSFDVGGREAVKEDLGALPADDSPLGAYARELLAQADMEAKDYKSAIAGFDALIKSASTPPAVRSRSTQFIILAKAGEAGVNVSGEARVEDLLETLGGTPNNAPGTAPNDGGAGDQISNEFNIAPADGTLPDLLTQDGALKEAVDKVKSGAEEVIPAAKDAAKEAAKEITNDAKETVTDKIPGKDDKDQPDQ